MFELHPCMANEKYLKKGMKKNKNNFIAKFTKKKILIETNPTTITLFGRTYNLKCGYSFLCWFFILMTLNY